jgi:hypothetical protein
LYHADIIPTIADAAHPLSRMFANQPRYVCLLSRRTAACNDSRQLCGDLDELIFKQIQTEL